MIRSNDMRVKISVDNKRIFCEKCGEFGSDVHHIIPIVVFHDDSVENLMLLCKSCHSKIEAELSEEYREVFLAREEDKNGTKGQCLLTT